MSNKKASTFNKWLEEKLKDEDFRANYREAKLAAQVAHDMIQLRKGLHLSQADLAKRMDTKQQTISRLESGDYSGFTLTTLLKFAAATRTELSIKFKPLPKRRRGSTSRKLVRR